MVLTVRCTKNIVITAYKVQFVDLREEKPRTPKEEIYTMDRDWLDAMGLLHVLPHDFIKARYEKAGYRVFSVEQIKPKQCVIVDLNELYMKAEAVLQEDD